MDKNSWTKLDVNLLHLNNFKISDIELNSTDNKIVNYPLEHFKVNEKDFILKLDVSEKVKEELKDITPFNYTGY